MPPTVIDLEPKHIPAAAQVLAAAFRDDPLFRYIYSDFDRYDRAAPWMFGTWTAWAIRYGRAWGTPGLEAVALRRPPGAYQMSLWSMVRAGMLPAPVRMGWAAFNRLERFVAAAERAHNEIMATGLTGIVRMWRRRRQSRARALALPSWVIPSPWLTPTTCPVTSKPKRSALWPFTVTSVMNYSAGWRCRARTFTSS